jgi:hypothetical protein
VSRAGGGARPVVNFAYLLMSVTIAEREKKNALKHD